MLDTVSAKNSVDFPRVNGSDIRITSVDARSRDDCFLLLACKRKRLSDAPLVWRRKSKRFPYFRAPLARFVEPDCVWPSFPVFERSCETRRFKIVGFP